MGRFAVPVKFRKLCARPMARGERLADRPTEQDGQQAEHQRLQRSNADHLDGSAATAAQHRDLVTLLSHRQADDQGDKGKNQADNRHAESVEQDGEQRCRALVLLQGFLGRNVEVEIGQHRVDLLAHAADTAKERPGVGSVDTRAIHDQVPESDVDGCLVTRHDLADECGLGHQQRFGQGGRAVEPEIFGGIVGLPDTGDLDGHLHLLAFGSGLVGKAGEGFACVHAERGGQILGHQHLDRTLDRSGGGGWEGAFYQVDVLLDIADGAKAHPCQRFLAVHIEAVRAGREKPHVISLEEAYEKLLRQTEGSPAKVGEELIGL